MQASDVVPALSYDGLCVAGIGTSQAAPKVIAAIPESVAGGSLWAVPVAFDSDGIGVYYDVYGKGTWYAREGIGPIQALQGSWSRGDAHPILGGRVLAVVREAGSKTALYLMAGEDALRFAEHPNVSVLAFDSGRLAVFARSGTGRSEPGRVIEYNMTRQ